MLNTESTRASALKKLYSVISGDDTTLLWEVDKTKEWSGCQGNTTKESELDPVGKGESLRDLSCT